MSPATRRLQLFISGRLPNSRMAAANLKRIARRPGLPPFDIEIVDVDEQPERAAAAGVIRTPTLVAASDPSAPKLIGDLSAESEVLDFLMRL